MQSDFIFTSESVTDGHPDKLCDQISDAVVGHFLKQDPAARVIAECAVTTGLVFLSVKFRSTAAVNAGDIARDVVGRVGYDGPSFSAKNCTVMTSLHELPVYQGPEERDLDDGELDRLVAQDQATLFGFACSHTPALMPLPIALAHKLARQIDVVRRRTLRYLAPDAKTQVGVEFHAHRPRRIHGVTLIASQLERDAPQLPRLRDDLIEAVIRPVFADEPIRPDDRTRVAINPEGPIFPGGPASHAGLTGRKTAVDTYGEFARHSGAALSGKDPSRIDRIGAYGARHAARNVVSAGLADLCEVQLTYSVGLPGPVSIQVETYGTGRIDEGEISRRVAQAFDFRVGAIVRRLRLREFLARDAGFFRKLAVYGHMGRTDLDLPWEKSDKVDALRS